jgi:hypothetical protein
MEARHKDPQDDRASDHYRVLLSSLAGNNFYIYEKKDATALNASIKDINKMLPIEDRLPAKFFAEGKNYSIGDHSPDSKVRAVAENALHAILANGGKGSDALTSVFARPPLSLDREKVTAALTGNFRPAHDLERDAATFLDSPLVSARGRPEMSGPGTAIEKLQTLSQNNLGAINSGIESYRNSETIGNYSKIIDTFMADVEKRYANGTATHATNNMVQGCIACTSDRKTIEEAAIELSGDRKASQKLSHTAATNTNQLQTHDFVFFNVYPKTHDDLQKDQLLSTRYLRENPEVKGSPMAAEARSFTFPIGDLADKEGKLSIVALRDPVYPVGGTTREDAQKRMEQGGFSTYVDKAHSAGTAERKFGELVDRYDTHRNLFVGPDIEKALVANVRHGLYKTFDGLHTAAEKNPSDDRERSFYAKLHSINEMTEGKDKDRAVSDVIKMYQYPQLLVSGSVPVKDAQLFLPGQQLAKASDEVVHGRSVSSPAHEGHARGGSSRDDASTSAAHEEQQKPKVRS